MKSTLVLTLLFFLSACSDSASDKQSAASAASSKEAPAPQEVSVTADEPAEVPSTEPAEASPEPAAPSPEPAKPLPKVEEPSPAVSQPTPKPAATEPPAAQSIAKAANGRLLFAQKCASCHGTKGEKMALNKSQIIAGWEKERVLTALNGYRDGSYGGSMKGIMKGQVGTLSEEELQALSDYIPTL